MGNFVAAIWVWWMRWPGSIAGLAALLAATLLSGHSSSAKAQAFERWFQVEMTIFANESSADRERENWRPGQGQPQPSWPDEWVQLRQPLELLLLDTFSAEAEADAAPGPASTTASSRASEPGAASTSDSAGDLEAVSERDLARLRETGPFPPVESTGFRFPDLGREAFIALPPSQSDFRQTNLALERSPQYRVLFAARWRQPVGDVGSARPVLVAGGAEVGPHRELQGTVALEFNANRDRVVLLAELWLSEFGGETEETWMLPAMPAKSAEGGTPAAAPAIRRIYTMTQERELRSNEFHYLDHPALGVVVQITPYEVPPPFMAPEC